jgi:hypothetical protein
VSLPADLPPIADAASPNSTNPSLFPLSATGFIEAPPGYVEDLPPCCDPVTTLTGKRGPEKGGKTPGCHVWASAEPLLWWVRPGSTPALVSTDGSLNYGTLPGGRLAAGFTTGEGDVGLQGSGFFLGRATARSGNAASSSQLWGTEANAVGSAYDTERLAIDLLGGLRYLTLDEDLTISPPAGVGLGDSSRTRNQFLGGQFGSQVELRWGRLYTNVLGKVAVGNMHQLVDQRNDFLLSLPAGAGGKQAHDEFGVVPELNLNVGCQLRPGLHLYAGYTCLYLNDVTRPGDQGTATPTSPAVSGTGLTPLNRTDFWAQGVNFGVALRY